MAYAAFMADRNEETRARIVACPRRSRRHADEIAGLGERVRVAAEGRRVAGDAEAAAELARAAARVARRLAS